MFIVVFKQLGHLIMFRTFNHSEMFIVVFKQLGHLIIVECL